MLEVERHSSALNQADHAFAPSRLLKKIVRMTIFVTCGSKTKRLMGLERRSMRYVGGPVGSFSMLQTDSSRRGQQLWDANEIVGCGGEHEEPLDQAATAMPRLAQAADRLDPPERLLDQLAFDGADPIAGMAGGTRVDRRAAVGVVLRDMRRAAALAATGDEVGSVVVLVAADRAAGPGIVLDHVERSRALGGAVGLGQPRVDDEAVAILRHQMPHVAELGLLASALAEQAGVGVRRRGMRGVFALLAMEVALGMAGAAAAILSRVRLVPIFRHEALHAGPGLDQRTVNRKVLAGQQATHLRLG